MRRQPYVLGGVCLVAGYCCAAVSGTNRVVSNELMAFHRAEQMVRLKRFFARSGATS